MSSFCDYLFNVFVATLSIWRLSIPSICVCVSLYIPITLEIDWLLKLLHCVLHQEYLYFIVLIFLEGDPHNYLTYFKRGTVYLALGKSKFALMDLDKVLQLKPDFNSVSIMNIRYLITLIKINCFSSIMIWVMMMMMMMMMMSSLSYPS